MPTKARRSPKAKRRQARQPAGVRARNRAAIRQRIVRAALTLFQTRGFEATTTRSIARKAGIAEGTVFNYFGTKEEIALSFFADEVDHAMAAVRSNPRLRKAPLEEKLFALVQSQLEYLGPHERFIGAALIEALRPASPLGPFSQPALDIRTRYLDFVQELIEESLPRHRPHPMAWIGSQAFWIFYVGVLLFWLNDPSVGKQNTLAFLDRTLTLGVSFIRGTRR